MTGQWDRCSTAWLTEPSRRAPTPPRPCEPRTRSCAVTDCSTSARAGASRTTTRRTRHVGVLAGPPGEPLGELRAPLLLDHRPLARGERGVEQEVPPGVHRHERHRPGRRRLERRGQRGLAQRRAVDAEDHGSLRRLDAPDDHHRAGPVRGERGGHRPEEQPDDPAPAPVADHDELGRGGLVEQSRHREPVEDLLLDDDVRGRGRGHLRRSRDARRGPRRPVRRAGRARTTDPCTGATAGPSRPPAPRAPERAAAALPCAAQRTARSAAFDPSTPTTTGRCAFCTSIGPSSVRPSSVPLRG